MSKRNRNRRAADHAQVRIWINEHAYIITGFVQSNLLVTTEDIQRDTDLAHVAEIKENFNVALLDPLKVSHRDGEYFVFDGGHRLLALKDIHKGEESFPVECRIFENLTHEEEAQLFALQCGSTKPIPFRNELNSLKVAGDPETLALYAATTKAGLRLPWKDEPGDITAIKKCKSLFGSYGEERYVEILLLIKETWGINRDALTSNFMGAVAIFLKEFGNVYLRQRFIKKLTGVDPKELVIEAKRMRLKGQSADAALASIIGEKYNFGGGKGRIIGRSTCIMY